MSVSFLALGNQQTEKFLQADNVCQLMHSHRLSGKKFKKQMDRPNLHVQDSITEEKAISRVKEITIEKRRGDFVVFCCCPSCSCSCLPSPLKQNKN